MTLSAPSAPSPNSPVQPSTAFEEAVSAERLRGSRLKVSPTDISQFIRLDQCQRYLRLRLHEQNGGTGFFKAIDADAVPIPQLLTKSGLEFEQRVEADIERSIQTTRLPGAKGRRPDAENDNQTVVDVASHLGLSERHALLQPKLTVDLHGWRLSGVADLVLMSRSEHGDLEALVIDFKSSKAARLEHRLQAAIYRAMLRQLFDDAGMSGVALPIAILYRGAAVEEPGDEERAADALQTLGVDNALLERVARPDELDDAAHDLLLGPASVAHRIAGAEFGTVPFHLTHKCDGCLYNQVCLKSCARTDDLSLIPHLTEQDKTVLNREGVRTAKTLAAVREETPVLAKRLSTTWPVGPRMDELIARARRYRQSRGDAYAVKLAIPDAGHGSLPYAGAVQNPNLVRVYLDVQHDYLNDRLYLAGSLISAAEGGVEGARRRSVVRISAGPPETEEIERELLRDWIAATIAAIVELAAPDENGEPAAPIHLIFFDRFDRRVLLDALGRHAAELFNATPLFDFITQLAAFDSPIATFLSEEIRAHRNYPMVCQSLQSVATYLRFDWDTPKPFRTVFRKRMFDYLGRFDPNELPEGDAQPWFTRQARFNSGIPLEYAYAAWGLLEPAATGEPDYQGVDLRLLGEFEARRLDAIERVAKDLPENRFTEQRSFQLPDLDSFVGKAGTLAEALREFVTLERHASLGEWKSARLAAPERRVLAGNSLIVRYLESDQSPDFVEKNRENARRAASIEQLPLRLDGKRIAVPPELKWSQEGLRVRLRLETHEAETSLESVISRSDFSEGDRVVISQRWTEDSRKPEADREKFSPTVRQLLHGAPAEFVEISMQTGDDGRPFGIAELTFGAGSFHHVSGFTFRQFPKPLTAGALYTIDESPNDVTGSWAKRVADDLCAGERNALYDRLSGEDGDELPLGAAGAEAQARFLAGLERLAELGDFVRLEPSKRRFIGSLGAASVVLVQGPPGTGKSFTTAFALLARVQAAMAEDRPCKIVVSCKTHAATDVLLKNINDAVFDLRNVRQRHPQVFAAYFDHRLLDAQLFRLEPRDAVPSGVKMLSKSSKGPAKPLNAINASTWCVVASTPGRIYQMLNERSKQEGLFNQRFADCLVLDEASQMNLPEAIMAALPLKDDGQIIIVGDHRQMPPIVQHNWLHESSRTFQEFRAYESVFMTMRERVPRDEWVQFAESFRVHEAMAEFLRREIYQQDGIPYFSKKTALLQESNEADAFVRAVLDSSHPLVVVVHDEAASQVRNVFEQELISPILRALADPAGLALDARDGLGLVVPHRTQRTALREGEPCLSEHDPRTGKVIGFSVDTVERFQGGERDVILIGATESDRQYLLVNGAFLLDPRRLTVALSRAKKKLILVASRSVFEFFSAGDEAFANAQIWKNLLRKTCTEELWIGERHGVHVVVYGNDPEPVRFD